MYDKSNNTNKKRLNCLHQIYLVCFSPYVINCAFFFLSVCVCLKDFGILELAV